MKTPNLVMIVMTVLMYCISTTHLSLALKVELIAFFDEHAIESNDRLTILQDQGNALVWLQIFLESFNVCRTRRSAHYLEAC